MVAIKSIEYFRVPPRWLFVKITDVAGNAGWGEASLEGHSEAVEGCLDAFADRFVGMDAEYARLVHTYALLTGCLVRLSTSGKMVIEWASIEAVQC